ncbi:alpha/beta fold hydrolase [Plantactinospora sp. KBS50]|uniref:alpha/beta fold hydrolase n=1 Tax=Plantactinospora sp. KBS50 TaxID=2024580 RepID=UPI000BAAC2C6|nr:alpha/beta fold hydrolase [Plantactinospora sp. KBS50]ASW56230.1 hypothetical protein CIK06_21825 [Plantactinospora sp. KBS50]
MTGLDLLDRLLSRHLAEGRGEATAYVDAEGRIGYADLHRAVGAYAARLAAAGIPPGSPALVVADDAVPTVVAVLALWWRGLVAVPVSPLLTGAELAFLAADCGARYLHLDARAATATPAEGALDVPRGGPDWAAPTDLAPPPPAVPGPDEVVLIQYTSGSTGVPKGVLHTVSGIAAVLDGFGRLLDLGPADRVLSTAKLSFGYGFGNSLLFPLAAGASTVLHAGPPDVYAVSAAIERHRPTVLCAVPRIYTALLDRARERGSADLGPLRLAVSAGEHLPAPVCAEFARVCGAPLVNGLGATEVLHIVVATRGTEPGSTGTAVPGALITVRDDDGREVADGTEGRLHVAGRSVAAGYLDRPEAAARTFADGGAYTGDVVRRGPDGTIGYVCRRDDLLNIGGFKVSPFEIEAAARGVPGLAQCAVVGSRDARGLEQAVAYVVPEAGADRAELRRVARAAFRRGLPPFKRPVTVEVVDELPVTSTGKLARYRLRAAPVRAAEVTLRTLRAGDGPTLLCIPHAGGSPGAFSRLARQLPDGWRVLAGAAEHDADADLDQVARAWADAVRPYLSDRTVLLGHSLGAVLALAVAELVGAELAGTRLLLAAPPLRERGAVRALLTEPDDGALIARLSGLGLLPETSLSPEEIGRLLLPRFRRDIALAPDGLTGPVTVPVRVLVGAGDRLCPPEAVPEDLPAELVLDCRVVAGGHYFPTAEPAAAAAAIAELFA